MGWRDSFPSRTQSTVLLDRKRNTCADVCSGACRLWNHLTGEQLAQVQLTQAPEADAAAEAADGAADSTAEPEAAAPAEAGAAAYATPLAAQVEQPGAAAADGDGAEEQGADEAGAGGQLLPSCPRPAAIITLAVSPNKCVSRDCSCHVASESGL